MVSSVFMNNHISPRTVYYLFIVYDLLNSEFNEQLIMEHHARACAVTHTEERQVHLHTSR